jgi:hypothetical protein
MTESRKWEKVLPLKSAASVEGRWMKEERKCEQWRPRKIEELRVEEIGMERKGERSRKKEEMR